MKRNIQILLGVGIAAVLGLYAIAFQVRFDQSAIVLTFGKADSSAIINAGDQDEAGLHWKWPWPIQEVRYFDKRLRPLDDLLEQQETKDKQVVVLKTYLTWQITDPLAYYRTLQSDNGAEQFLRNRMRTARAEIGKFSFDELTNEDPARLRLPEAEKAILNRLRNDLAGQGYGIEVASMGVKRILLPKQITEAVFRQMRQTRQRLAQNARSEGQATARSIRAAARSDQQRILAFAQRKAQSIRAEGDAAAAQYYRVFAQNEDFAVFIRKLEALESILSKNSTFLLDTKLEPFDLLKDIQFGDGAKTNPEEAKGK
jgi:membrane protease subunit HflC